MTCSLRQNIVDDLELNNLVKHDGEGFKITGPLNAVQEKQDKYFKAVEDEYRATEDVFFVDGDYVKFNEPLLEAIYRKDNGVIAPPTDEAVSAEFELLQSVNMILTKLGLTSKSVDKLRDRDGNPIKGVAVADILNRSIQYLEGKQEEVPEEVIHFFVQALKELNDPLYISMAERVHKEPEYAEVLTTYSDLGYSEEDLLDEAIAKVILNRVKTTLQSSKQGVQELFDSNPELANIGTPEQYSAYLDSIFPNSKVRDIVYHGANEPIEGEKFVKKEGATGKGIWFSGSKKYAQIQMDRAQPSESLIGRKLRGAPTMYQVVLNIKNPKNFYNATGALLVQTPSKFEEQYDRKNNDAALFHHPNSKKPATADSADQVVVFEPEQISYIR